MHNEKTLSDACGTKIVEHTWNGMEMHQVLWKDSDIVTGTNTIIDGFHFNIITVGEPELEKCLELINKYTHYNHAITLWFNEFNIDHYYKYKKYSDDIVMSSRNYGGRAIGYMLLNSRYKYLVSLCSDAYVTENWLERVLPVLKEPNMGVVGHNKYNDFDVLCDSDNFPDHFWIIKKEVIEKIGSISPSNEVYGHTSLELFARIYKAGIDIAGLTKLVNHGDNGVSRQLFKSKFGNMEKEISLDTARMIRCMKKDFTGYNWWSVQL